MGCSNLGGKPEDDVIIDEGEDVCGRDGGSGDDEVRAFWCLFSASKQSLAPPLSAIYKHWYDLPSFATAIRFATTEPITHSRHVAGHAMFKGAENPLEWYDGDSTERGRSYEPFDEKLRTKEAMASEIFTHTFARLPSFYSASRAIARWEGLRCDLTSSLGEGV
jgi:hypothetical protein